jgi:hypothetical protein
VRHPRDPAWDDFRAAVPLTGREPLLGRLRLKLRCRPGAGWIGLSGPRGAGISRILRELYDESLAAEGSHAVLWVAPTEPGAARAEPLRRALVPWAARAPLSALEAALAPVVPLGQHGARALLAWVGAGPLAAAALLPPSSVLVAALEALAEGGLICADDWGALDALTCEVLVTAARGARLTVLAGHVPLDTEEAAPGPVWPMEPLAAGQIGLMLKRWLRSPVTARRLADDLARRSEGWPGRAVGLARALARAGVLVHEERGARLTAWPAPWPEPHLTFEACLQRLKEDDASGWRVVEAAALMTEPADPEMLAEAAGVKRSVVDDVLAEASAARMGHAPGCVLGDGALRAGLRQRLVPARRAQAVERLVRAYGRRPFEALRGAGEALARLEAACEGGTSQELAGLLPHVLAWVPHKATLVPAVAEMLARAARRLLTLEAQPDPLPVLAVADRLGRAGHLEVAQDLLDALQVPAGSDAELEHLCLRVRHGDAEHAAEAAGPLEVRLAETGLSDVCRHRGWRALAEREGADAGAARRAWRRTLTTVPACGLTDRASLHAALAQAAERAQRPHAFAAHMRRAAVLEEALGAIAEAAELWQRLGVCERRLGRLELAAAAFEASARDWQVLGEHATQALAIHCQGQIALARAHFDEAYGLLTRALGCATPTPEAAAPRDALAQLHLDLARAHRGRGDLAAERSHAALAHACAETAASRLVAQATLLVADVRAGLPGALEALDPVLHALDVQGPREVAAEVRAIALDARLSQGDLAGAERLAQGGADGAARLAQARVLRLRGELDLCVRRLEDLGRDAAVPVELRAEAFARLAELQVEQSAADLAREAAQAAEALLELPHRSRQEDARVHRLLARAYRGVGEPARSARHRVAARLALHLPAKDVTPAGLRRRWMRARLGRDRRTAIAAQG